MTRNIKHFSKVGVAALLGVFVVGSVATAAAEEGVQVEQDCSDCYRVDAIVVEGLLRTHREVVEQELLFEEGDVATLADVEESVQRLRNTGIFRTVTYEFVDQRIGVYGNEDYGDEDGDQADEGPSGGPDQGRLLRVVVDERFTISPSFRFGQGGDTFRLLLGLQDVNLGGKYLQAGGTYSRLGDANSFSLWFRNPRFLGQRQELSLRGGIDNRIYTLYDDEAQVEGGFLRTQRYASAGLSREWHRWFRTGASLSFSSNSFSYDLVGDVRRDAQEERGGLYDPVHSLGFSLSSRFGRLDYQEYRVRGTTLDTRFSQSFYIEGPKPRTSRFVAALRHFVELPLESTLGFRGTLGFSTGEMEYQKFSAGGLDAVRGTYNMRHRGKHYWQTNMELRVPAFTNNIVVVQGVGFVDGVNVTRYPSQIFDVTAVTTGLGVRIISRDFHGFIIRADYALPVLGVDGPSFSFGAGQFF